MLFISELNGQNKGKTAGEDRKLGLRTKQLELQSFPFFVGFALINERMSSKSHKYKKEFIFMLYFP